MNRSFVSQFLNTNSQTLCGCLQQTMTILQERTNQSQITFKSIQNMLKPVPPDLKIICEDKKEYSSHKLLFGLSSPILASIFLDDEFISEKVTLFMPISSELLENMINEEFLLKNKLQDLFSTSLHRPAEDRDVIKYLHESRSIELIKAEGKFEFKDEGDQSREADNGDLDEEEGEIDNPVRISFKKERKRLLKTKKKKIVKTPIPCEDCGKIFRNIATLKFHRKNFHEDQENVTCEDCGKICRNIVSLKFHRKNNHDNPENVLQQCDKCSYSTLHRYLLDQHIKSQHNYGPTVQCTECGKSFFGQNLYKAHFRRMHTKQELFPCKECGKEFKKHRLQIHIAQMHRERRFACHLCSYKAQSGYNLRLHISKSHLGIKELPKHKCPHCDIETTNLDYHIKSSHKNII